jgi:hypothetical protein
LARILKRRPDAYAAQLRAGFAIINAAIEGKIKLIGTPCARWQTEAHLLRLRGHRIAIGSLIPFERSLSPFVDEPTRGNIGTIPATIKIEDTQRYREVLWLGDLDSNQD